MNIISEVNTLDDLIKVMVNSNLSNDKFPRNFHKVIENSIEAYINGLSTKSRTILLSIMSQVNSKDLTFLQTEYMEGAPDDFLDYLGTKNSTILLGFFLSVMDNSIKTFLSLDKSNRIKVIEVEDLDDEGIPEEIKEILSFLMRTAVDDCNCPRCTSRRAKESIKVPFMGTNLFGNSTKKDLLN